MQLVPKLKLKAGVTGAILVLITKPQPLRIATHLAKIKSAVAQ